MALARSLDIGSSSLFFMVLGAASLWSALSLGCDGSDLDPEDREPDHPSLGQGGEGGVGAGFSAPTASEPCNGLDDDGDGAVDEGCACESGATQACFGGSASQLNVGVCRAGVQSCVVTEAGEFATNVWGECEGAVAPAAEVCGDGVDQDCDGADLPCGGEGGAGGGGSGDGGGGGGGGCTPSPEICDNGIDEDCDGIDAGCVVDVDIFLLGDCITASCPSSHPYPVGCEVFFSPGDDRGCIASTPATSAVYFQAGDQCNAGLVTGTLSCSTQMGAPLSAATCPINKPVPIYASAPAGCPEIID